MSNCEMPYDENEITLYNPIYETLNVTPKKKVDKYVSRNSYNKYTFVDISGVERECFKKYITLVDYVKFLIGKYEPENMKSLPSKEKIADSSYNEYIHSIHNYAYVDGFFYYLTSKLKDVGFVHGIDFYDSYVCLTKDCNINISDDFEYLCDSSFFNDNLNKLFKFKDPSFNTMFQRKEPVTISDEKIEIEADELSDSDDDLTLNALDLEEIIPDECYNSETCDSDHSTVDNSDDECESERSSGSEWSTDDDTVDVEVEDLVLVINKIPTQVVSIECCEMTFDSILESDKITMEELESAMFQIIVMLHVYQSVYHFTHNDLHTNNIMYVTTDKTHLSYKINNVYYKIPTYGKIYKIIDFGRSIYTVKDTLICSDSFSENGTAHTQYNFKPFYNPDKPIIEPNNSFDLCRLACSMIDFIVEDFKHIDDYRKVPVYDMILSWLYDDNNVNILYKKNGDERYPDFKLYKMIARLVHNHTPEKQFDHECFKKYITNKHKSVMDIDKIKSQVHL
jgi:hypothetical protein